MKRFFVNYIIPLIAIALMLRFIPFRGNPTLSWIQILKITPILLVGLFLLNVIRKE